MFSDWVIIKVRVLGIDHRYETCFSRKLIKYLAYCVFTDWSKLEYIIYNIIY